MPRRAGAVEQSRRPPAAPLCCYSRRVKTVLAAAASQLKVSGTTVPSAAARWFWRGKFEGLVSADQGAGLALSCLPKI